MGPTGLARVCMAGALALGLSLPAVNIGAPDAGGVAGNTAVAGPPPWAPAHGYRAKQGKGPKHHHHRHYGQRYDHAGVPTFGVLDGHCNRELLGQVLGGAAGAAIGSQIGGGSGQTAATIGGAILGVLIGGDIGRQMDSVDQRCVGQVLEHAPSGQTVAWENPDEGARYTVQPTNTFQRGDGRYCREYITEATVGGRTEQVYGTACRQPDGDWEIVS